MHSILIQHPDLSRSSFCVIDGFKIQRESLSGTFFEFYLILLDAQNKQSLWTIGKDKLFSVGVKPSTLYSRISSVSPGETFTYSRKQYSRLVEEEFQSLFHYSVYLYKGVRSI